ncbi:MAG: DEAD/DEAH box helicase [Verrucomicrobiales bacterium]|nr:DEAD/DEAH box helicase [Verrucomicrobiales bacterium]
MSITFDSLALSEPIQKALRDRDYTTPSPIQEKTIPYVLEGSDVMGCAQTGTGKTAAFALPILEHLSKNQARRTPKSPRVLVIAPTRELAIQIHESFLSYGKHLHFRSEVIFGGVGQNPQVRAIQKGPEILVATPGRLLDLIGQGHIRLNLLEVFVIDEADRMLDMGFIHDVRKVIRELPDRRQSLFFSATMPDSIIELAGSILRDPEHVEVTPPATTVEKIDQRLCHVASSDKRALLTDLIAERGDGLSLVFTGMKHVANRIAEHLTKSGIPAAAIHGNKSQSARVRALEEFRSGKIKVLVATDIAARGIDVKGIDLVINYDLPNEPDSYVHRIGRTARAGAEGRAISLCDEKSQGMLRDIEKTIRMQIPLDTDHNYHRDPQPGDRDEKQGGRGGNRGGGRGRGRGGNGGGNNRPRGGNSRGSGGGGGSRNRNSRNRNRSRRTSSAT